MSHTPSWLRPPHVRNPLVGRADLVLVLEMAGREAQSALATQLGYEREEPEIQLPQYSEPPPKIESVAPASPPDPTLPRRPVLFWRAERLEVRDAGNLIQELEEEQGIGEGEKKREGIPEVVFEPLASSVSVLTRLRHESEVSVPGPRVDLTRLVADLSVGRQLVRLPRLAKRSWGTRYHVIIDLARRLIPYRQDQQLVEARLRRILPRSVLTVSSLKEGTREPRIDWPEDLAWTPLHPESGSTVLVLGDLGALQKDGSEALDTWLDLGRQWRARGCRTFAMVPCRPDALSKDLAAFWTAIRWERLSGVASAVSPQETEKALARLLALASRALRVEPRLLRALRRLFPEGARDAGLEGRFWQAAGLTQHIIAASFTEEQAKAFRARLAGEPLADEAFALIQKAHETEYEGMRHLEVLNLGREARELVSGAELRKARAWFAKIEKNLKGEDPDYLKSFFQRAHGQITAEGYSANPVLSQLWQRLVCREGETSTPPEGYDPALAAASGPVRTLVGRQVGNRVIWESISGGGELEGSPLGVIRYRAPFIARELTPEAPQTPAAPRPSWVDRAGVDGFGTWAELVVGGARQRLRWIPPGRFFMGSPESEEGRYDDEGPRHEVTLTHGFWLFDTPCTQELWEAVMGENPSNFKGARRPVETVSWEDARRFIEQMNARWTDLKLRLPTEAQWEYACRAGSMEARYGDDLDNIAWYDKNSGGETHPVGMKDPNGWGLYDTLGNVDEWCADSRRKYLNDSPRDPEGLGDTEAFRVIRGGAWYYPARSTRAACRRAFPPGRRISVLGFRCFSSGQSPEGWLRGPAPARSRFAEGGAGETGETPGDGRWLSPKADKPVAMLVPSNPFLRLTSDLEVLTFGRITRPKWARAMGRDRFGLWAEFAIERKKQPPVVQRMRWIPPGRFVMGSPESEEGRWEAEGPQCEEVVSRGYWLFDTPCTQELWTAVMGQNPSKFQGPRRPVVQVSWEDCNLFTRRLTEVVSGLFLKLPTEAQWEYACRAGTESSRYAENLEEIAWYDKNSGDQTHDVSGKLPNSWGLFDMLGNVWEWCEDAWRDNYDSKPVEGLLADRVLRGGAWHNPAGGTRAAFRYAYHPGYRSDGLGFRCSSSESEPENSQPRPEPERSPAADASAVAKAKADRERGEGEAQGSGGLMNTLKGLVGIKPAKSKSPNPGRKPSK